MISPYQSILSYDEGDDFFDNHLKKLHLFETFKCLLQEFPQKEIFKGVVHFILYGYSLNSDMLQTTGLTWDKLAKKIFEKTELPEEYYEQVAMLESDSVREAIDRWLIYQNNDQWTQYITYRDLRRQFLSASLFPLPKSKKDEDGEGDFNKIKTLIEAKMIAATNSESLLKMMEDAKQRFIQTQPKLKISISELNRVTTHKSTKTTEEIFASHGN